MQHVFFDSNVIKITYSGSTKIKLQIYVNIKKIISKTWVREDDSIAFHGQLREKKITIICFKHDIWVVFRRESYKCFIIQSKTEQ